ncbi:MAG: hypothetical protein WCK46_03345 [Candidatus Adlerbacteria bacterium]
MFRMLQRHTVVLLCVAVVALFACTGHFLYTGKGWLLVTGKERVADFYFNRGLYYFGGGAYNLRTAQSSFEQALAHAGGRYPFAHYQLSRVYFIQSDFASALFEADAELATYPDHFRTHYIKGLTYGYRKQYIQAAEEFKLFIAGEPTPTWAGYNDLAWIYFAEGDYQAASDITKKGMVRWPGSPWLQNSYAVAQLNLGNYAAAQTYLESAQKLFEAMTPAQWGAAYSGNDPSVYASGLEQTRATIAQNLILVHSKLGSI